MAWPACHDPVSAGTHALWLVLAVPATICLLSRTRGQPFKQAGFAIFGMALVLCYGGSTLWHTYRQEIFGKIDYIGIFVLIAGTTTPIVMVVLEGVWRKLTLTFIWLMAAGGISLCLIPITLPTRVFTVLYLAMGWGMCVCYFELARNLSHKKLGLILLGGFLYSTGALLNLARWPVLAPGLFGAHELFHLFVMAGTLTHFLFMFRVVVPFEKPLRALLLEPAEGLEISPSPGPVVNVALEPGTVRA